MNEKDNYGSALRDRMKTSMERPAQVRFTPLNQRERKQTVEGKTEVIKGFFWGFVFSALFWLAVEYVFLKVTR